MKPFCPGFTATTFIVSKATSVCPPSATPALNDNGVENNDAGILTVAVSWFCALPSVNDVSSVKLLPPPVNL